MIALLGLPNIVVATIVAALGTLILRARVLGTNERTATSWIDAWLKAIAMVVFITFVGVYVPSYILQTSTVANLDRNVQDILGTGAWLIAMVVTFGGLRLAHSYKKV